MVKRSVAQPPSGAQPLKANNMCFDFVKEFLGESAAVESSFILETVVDAVGECTTLQEMFKVPLQHFLFGMDVALRWVLFLRVLFTKFQQFGELNCNEAFGVIIQVYDLGVEGLMPESFEDSENGDD